MIRAAEAADAAELMALWNPWIKDTSITFNAVEKTVADICAMIAERPCVMVYVNNGVQGFATYGQFRGGIGYATCMEHTIILSPNARGTGAGRALMAAIEADAKAKGVHQMIAAVSGENPGACAFHAAIGYQACAHVREAGFKFGRFMDLILMQKILS